ncbi:hypothetical protein ACOSP7_027289 [Xanthoceras sorbifolium]
MNEIFTFWPSLGRKGWRRLELRYQNNSNSKLARADERPQPQCPFSLALAVDLLNARRSSAAPHLHPSSPSMKNKFI